MNFFIIDELGFEPESKLLFSYMTVEPSSGTKRNINTLIRRLKADNNWQYIDRLWVTAAISNQHARLNWKNPAVNTLTLVNAPTFTSKQGYTGNGTTSYLNTGFKPDTDADVFVQNNSSAGVYLRLNPAADVSVAMGSVITDRTVEIYPKHTDAGGTFYCALTGTGVISGGTTSDASGFLSCNRTVSTTITIWKNGVQQTSTADTSTAIVSQNIYLLARNVSGTADKFNTNQISCAFLGTGDIDHLKFYNAFQSYMTVLGTQV